MMKKELKLSNEPVSSITHLVASLFSVAALVILIVFATLYGTVWHIVGFSIFGAALILLYTSSTLYHFFNVGSKAKKVYQRIDHSMIFVLIAATYTPICLTVLRGPWGWSIFGVVWTIAAVGIVLKSCGIGLKDGVSAFMYVLMGWVIVVALYPLLKAVPLSGFYWLLAGGLFYTSGVLFFSLETMFPRKRKWSFGMHEIFHIFVILGSFSHFWFVINYLA